MTAIIILLLFLIVTEIFFAVVVIDQGEDIRREVQTLIYEVKHAKRIAENRD